MNEFVTEDLVYCDVHQWTKPSRHHIIPGSRGGGDNYFSLWRRLLQGFRRVLGLSPLKGDRSNINKRTCAECHPRSHLLYANKAPTEIIRHNVENLWDGQKRWVYIYLWQDFIDKLRKLLHMPPRERESGVTLQPIQTDRLRGQLEDELLLRRIAATLGIDVLEGDLRIQKAARGLGLNTADLYLVDRVTQEITAHAKRNGREKTQRELLEELLNGRELRPCESIHPMIWKPPRPDPTP